ncbi:hypothetical protein BJX66DRAFT_331799 [Aspergillus keveii]|uniref:Uncharacterized protein n=1 Tax=Aspergillus keveii TaxID=714993 RepID=A0ABR4GP58_9EURO
MTTADEAHAIAPANPTKLESMITINEISDSKSSQNVELGNNMLEQQPYTGLLLNGVHTTESPFLKEILRD